ncbi:MAG: hypothetical protein EOR99_35015 [Mesorhizobium sp.]|nr:MAG: hypothetical protein EOR99_35015 [Mesorhizobium sp.]
MRPTTWRPTSGNDEIERRHDERRAVHGDRLTMEANGKAELVSCGAVRQVDEARRRPWLQRWTAWHGMRNPICDLHLFY